MGTVTFLAALPERGSAWYAHANIIGVKDNFSLVSPCAGYLHFVNPWNGLPYFALCILHIALSSWSCLPKRSNISQLSL